MKRALSLALWLTCATHAAEIAAAQGTCDGPLPLGSQGSCPEDLFVPDDRVPLSPFYDADDAGGGTLWLPVRTEVLNWSAGAGRIRIAHRDPGGNLSYLIATGTISSGSTTLLGLDSPAPGKYVVVGVTPTNVDAIVTHWNSSLNGGRGGQQVGATNGLKTISVVTQWDPTAPEPNKYGKNDVTGSYQNTNCNFAHPQGGVYTFASDLYALFSDGSGLTDDELVPAYERYIGETYSVALVDALSAIWLSDQSVGFSGYPVLHRNHPEAFDPAQPPELQVQENIPFFQIVHGHVVDIGDTMQPNPVGHENSLASFVLPPNWTANPTAPYPILFNGYYDIHESTFLHQGPAFLETLGSLALENKQVVGVLWNGGGADACQTMHESALDNVVQLVDDAESLTGADRDKIVMTGGSRGGTTALLMAANRRHDPLPYTVPYVRATNPQVRFGESAATFANPTHFLLNATIQTATGYQDAWKSTWTDTWTHPSIALPIEGRHLMQWVFTGKVSDVSTAENTQDIDQHVSSDAPVVAQKLVDQGTQVVLRAGTHDFSRPFSHIAEYVDHLRSRTDSQGQGVDVDFDISYRFGHSHATNVTPTEKDLLDTFFGAPDPVADGDAHYKEDPATSPYDPTGIEFDPCHMPLVFEAPLHVVSGQRHTYDLVGPANALYDVTMQPVDVAGAPLGPKTPLLSGSLAPTTLGGFGTAVHEVTTFPTSTAVSDYWLMEASYSVDGGATWFGPMGAGTGAPPTIFPNREPASIITEPTPWGPDCPPAPGGPETLGMDDASRTSGSSSEDVTPTCP